MTRPNLEVQSVRQKLHIRHQALLQREAELEREKAEFAEQLQQLKQLYEQTPPSCSNTGLELSNYHVSSSSSPSHTKGTAEISTSCLDVWSGNDAMPRMGPELALTIPHGPQVSQASVSKPLSEAGIMRV
jgi:hypothetical protein